MTININLLRRLRDDIVPCGAVQRSNFDLVHIDSVKQGDMRCPVFRLTPAGHACLSAMEENERLKAELEEQRLVVRAHLYERRGRINPEWEPDNRMWRRAFPDGRTGQVSALYRDEEHHTVTWTMGVLGSVTEGRRPAVTGGTSDNLREGMRAVEKAWAATASPRPPSPADGA